MPVLKVKGMRRWCPAVSISPCLSLISILRGNFARLCRLNRCVSAGGKVVYFLFGMGSVWVLQCGCVWFEMDITTQFMPTGWQAGSLKDRPFSTLSVSFCFTFASPTLSTHSCVTLALFFFFFCLLLNKPSEKSNGEIFCGLQTIFKTK